MSTTKTICSHNSIYFKKLKKRANKCHTRLIAFEKKKRDVNKQYIRDLTKLVEHDLNELDSIVKTLVTEDDTNNVSPVTVEVSTNDDYFEQ